MTETILISALLLAAGMACLCVKLIAKPGSSFPSMHIHDSEAMRRRGIHCVMEQDREAREGSITKVKHYK